MNETTFQRIIRKTGRKPIQCKCQDCKKQCRQPCLGTPQDIEAIIDAGHADKIFPTDWYVGVKLGKMKYPVAMFQANITSSGCVFFKDGLCTLHDAGLKPTEGKLSHHSVKLDNYNYNKSLSYNVAKEWLDPDNAEVIRRIEQKMVNK